MSDSTIRLFDRVPTPDDVYAKAFAGTLDEGGTCGDDFLLGYITALADNGLVAGDGIMSLVGAAAQGSLARDSERLADPVCPKCGRPWEGPEDDG